MSVYKKKKEGRKDKEEREMCSQETHMKKYILGSTE